jgi:DNA-binding MarR family transcriptional regulator
MRTPEAGLELERFLPYRLSVLSNIVSARIARAYEAQFGLSIPEWRIIAVLARYPGLSAREAAERTAMDKVMVSRAVAGLLKDGRIARRAATHDRRFSTLSLTAKGRAIFAKVAPVARAIEGKLLSVLAPDEFESLDGLLAKLTQAAAALE